MARTTLSHALVFVILLCMQLLVPFRGTACSSLREEFGFSSSQLSKLPWGSSMGHATQGFGGKLVSQNSPLLRRNSSFEEWLMEALAADKNRAAALNSVVEENANVFSAWMQSRNLDPAQTSLQALDQFKKDTAAARVISVSPVSSQFYMLLEIGTPGQPALLVLDTGSELSWLQCEPCQVCFSQEEQYAPVVFDPAKSSTYVKIPCVGDDGVCAFSGGAFYTCSDTGAVCRYQISYLDGSYTTGDVGSDTVSGLEPSDGGSKTVPGFVFGCGTNNEGKFGGESGILGLDRGRLSFPSQLGSQNSTGSSNSFAHCLPDRFGEQFASEGYIFFGDLDELRPKGFNRSVQTTPLLTNAINPDFYFIGLEGISVGGKRVEVDADVWKIQSDGTGGTLVDTGTTAMVLHPDVFRMVLPALVEGTTGTGVARNLVYESVTGLGLCYSVEAGAVIRSGSLTLHFAGGFDWQLPVDNYLVPVNVARTAYCYAVFTIQGANFNIIGNIQLQNFLVEYDLKAVQFGFQAADCSLAA